MNSLKNLWNQRKQLVVTIGVTLILVAAVVIFALIMSGRNEGSGAANPSATADPNATPTADPFTVMYDLIGDWTRVDENPAGIIELDLHGDQTAVMVHRGVFDQEPESVATRWQAQDGKLIMITDGSEATEFDMVLSGDTLTLSYGSGTTRNTVTFNRPALGAPAGTEAGASGSAE